MNDKTNVIKEMPDFDREKMKKSGYFAGIKIGFSCPKCRVFMDNPPNPNMPICNNTEKHRLSETIHPVLYIDGPDTPVFIDMSVFGKAQNNIFHAIISNVNRVWDWVLNHEHIQDENLRDRIGQVEERLAAVESVVDKDE